MPQGGALCPRLFTLCISPVAWKLKTSEGYHLSKPVSSTTTHLYYIDDLKIYVSAQRKRNRVFKLTTEAMEDIGLQLNPTKCSTVHVRRGEHVTDDKAVSLNETSVIESLGEEVPGSARRREAGRKEIFTECGEGVLTALVQSLL